MELLALSPLVVPIAAIFFIFLLFMIILYTAIFFIIGWAAVFGLIFIFIGMMFFLIVKPYRKYAFILIAIGIILILLGEVGILEFGTLDLSLQQIGLG